MGTNHVMITWLWVWLARAALLLLCVSDSTQLSLALGEQVKGQTGNRMVRSSQNEKNNLDQWRICAPGTNKVKCFEQYLSLYVRAGKKKRSTKRAFRRSTLNIRPLVGTQSQWQLCPPGADRIQCFDWYLGSMMRTRAVQKRSALSTEAYPGDIEKRSKQIWNLCPDGQNKVSCFEDYVSLWFNVVADRESKRDYLGKRSSPGSGLSDLCPPGYDTETCARLAKFRDAGVDDVTFDGSDMKSRDLDTTTVLGRVGSKWRELCSENEDKLSCLEKLASENQFLDGEDAEKGISKDKLEFRKRDPASSLCPSGVDSMACFDRFLKMYAAKVADRGSNRFIGRSAEADDK